MQEMLIFQLFSVELQPKSPVSCKNRHEIFDVQEYNIKCNTFCLHCPESCIIQNIHDMFDPWV